MCTTTFLAQPGTDNFVFTVNRDEDENRGALPPKMYLQNGQELMYPKDKEKGGTWIGVSPKKRMVDLMNGAFKRHKRTPPYRKSRGLIVLDFLQAEDFAGFSRTISLNNVEPFTILCMEWQNGLQVFEFRWDGKDKFLREKSSELQVWSASMTYTHTQKVERENFIRKSLEGRGQKFITPQEIWDLHHSTRKEGADLDLIVDRGRLKTTSITQVIKKDGQVRVKFEKQGDSKKITQVEENWG